MKKIMFKIGVITVVLSCIFCALVTADELKFSDVSENSWYYEDVENAVERGLIKGKSISLYAPYDNLTYAEAVKLASCIHKLSIEGNADVEETEIWYSSYIDYAKNEGIITKDYNWGQSITRAEYLDIFSRALPSDKLKEINSVPDNSIPDVFMNEPTASAIYLLYRAGIVQGSDSLNSCKPNSYINRAEVAAILTRMLDETKRCQFEIVVPEYRKKYNTGCMEYDKKLDEYGRALTMNDETFHNTYTDGSSINILMLNYARGNYAQVTLAYTLIDVDNNGIPELVISDYNSIIDIYTISNNGDLVKLFDNCYFGERGRLYALYDGTLLSEGSNSSDSCSYSLYRFNSTGDSIYEYGGCYYDLNGPDKYMGDYIYTSIDDYYERLAELMEKSVLGYQQWKLLKK